MIKGLAAAIVVSEVYIVDEGVTYGLTSTLSKKAYNLVFGLNPSPVTVIFLGRTKGINALDIILEPCDSSSILVLPHLSS